MKIFFFLGMSVLLSGEDCCSKDVRIAADTERVFPGSSNGEIKGFATAKIICLINLMEISTIYNLFYLIWQTSRLGSTRILYMAIMQGL